MSTQLCSAETHPQQSQPCFFHLPSSEDTVPKYGLQEKVFMFLLLFLASVVRFISYEGAGFKAGTLRPSLGRSK